MRQKIVFGFVAALLLHCGNASWANSESIDAGSRSSGQIRTESDLHVHFVNVGQGDSEFIELPNGKNVLIDGGPDTKSVAAFLMLRGVKRIDYVVLTHPHLDHYKGLEWVFGNLQVDHFYDTRMTKPVARDLVQSFFNRASSGVDTVREMANNEPGCEIAYPRPGDFLPWDDSVQVRVLNSCPDPVSDSNGAAINNCSIVIRLSYHGSSALFQGDAQLEALDSMIHDYGNELESTVLKVGHHGSKNATTEEWIGLVKPREAYIEVGKNGYGHPTKEALTILNNAGADVHRTDLSGTMEYVIH